jgi:SAM-dependent methyltransferase
MSHPEQLGFFELVSGVNTPLIKGASIIEIGAFDVNGSVRRHFSGASSYVGVDLVEGPGVDLVARGHEVEHPDGTYDVALSAECFEHDPHWVSTLTNMIRMTRPGGLVAFTCASRGRVEHGTRRTLQRDSPGTQSVGTDYYRNLGRGDVETALPLAEMFSAYKFWYLPTSFDLYFAGVRHGDASKKTVAARLPEDAEVAKLRSLMPLPHRAVRVPLRIAVRLVPNRRYQDVVVPYWNFLMRLARVTGRERLASSR